jgi:uncharacterized protein (TIGR03437 family)
MAARFAFPSPIKSVFSRHPQCALPMLGLLLAIIFGLGCQAQIRELATTNSGDQLYFTSLLGLRNVDSLPNSKIMRWSADRGLEIFAQRPNQGDLGAGLSNPYQLSYPNVSGDGSLITFAGARDCYIAFKFGCLIPNPPQTTILGSGPEAQVDGRYQLSPNGKFALRSLLGREPIYTLIDLNAGTSTDLPHYSINVSNRGAITNDGQVVFSLPGALHLWSPNSDRQFPTDFFVNSLAVSADGRIIVYTRFESAVSLYSHLYSLMTETGTVTPFPGDSGTATISRDGTLFTFLSSVDGLSGRQLFVATPDAVNVWQITSFPEGVREAVISGDGRIVFLVLENNRMLRYDVNSGDTEEISPRVAFPFNNYFVVVRGSTVTIRGTGLSDGVEQGTYPLPGSLAGARVEADGMPLLLISAEPGKIVAQVPFEMSAGKKVLNIAAPDGPLIAIAVRALVADFLPYWQNDASNGFALHDDLKRMVTFTDPARPDEVIHSFLTGMGDVTPPLQSGVLAPDQPELQVARPFQVVLRGSRQEVINMQVVKAILIPGTIGSYHVSIQVPDANLLNPDVNGYFFGTISFEPGDPLVGTFQTQFGQVPIKVVAQ